MSRHSHSPFKFITLKEDINMNKQKAIRTIVNAAKLYNKHLEGQKVLFLYGIPSEVKGQLANSTTLSTIHSYEVVFNKNNFLHLTGIRLNKDTVESPNHFYAKCLDNRLTENDFTFAKDGSTKQKLDILESIMKIKQNANMIGDFTDRGIKLYTQKVAGGTYGCIGFVTDVRTKLNVPNTLLKKDIRDVTKRPANKIFAIMSKPYTSDKYCKLDKIDKCIDLSLIRFTEDIEAKLDRKLLVNINKAVSLKSQSIK